MTVGTTLVWMGELFFKTTQYIKDNFDVLVKNIWTSFKNLPFLAQEWLNALINTIWNTINESSKLINKLPWVNIGEVKFWWIQKFDFFEWTELPEFPELKFTKKWIDEIWESFNRLIWKTEEFKKIIW